jgi:diguanylate cyclase (GGDEF)-like protein
VSLEISRRIGAPLDGSQPAAWGRAHLGMVAPLCVVVIVAIVCIVVAALTSAHRADDVAIAQERQLLVKAIVTRAEWSQGKLKSLALTADMNGTGAEWIQRHVGPWLDALPSHDHLIVTDAHGQAFSNTDGGAARPVAAAFPDLVPLLDLLHGRTGVLPPGVLRLTAYDGVSMPDGLRAPASYLLSLSGRSVVVSAVPLRQSGATTADAGSVTPIVLSLMYLDEELEDIGGRLNLARLCELPQGVKNPNDHEFDLPDGGGRRITRFSWNPRRPGAEVLKSVFPFIGITLAGFAVLAGLVLRYMRHTASTIAAGENRLRHLALHDPLCGLPNRIFFGERLEAAIASVKEGRSSAALLYIDLDHFKDINDTLGHPVGDELIRAVTLRLAGTQREGDLVARLGGDEFAVITSASGPAAVEGIAQRIIAKLSAPYSINGHTVVIGASVGIAVIDRGAKDAADIMRYADMALYRAKNEGRNRACTYDAAMNADLSHRKQIEQDLRETIENAGLRVLYQPIVNASGEKTLGVEALVRWPHPERGMISPLDFIPVAEHSGLIIQLGAFVLRQACEDGKAWPNVIVSVNVSPLQFRQIDFVEVVERILQETGFDPARLELELTESTLIGNVDSAEAAMVRLRSLGVRLALDDFGTGYSSLQYLRRFPFDRLKIDRSFVANIDKAADAAAIVHAVVSLGRGLGMKVTAEGVETADQHLFLRAAGVHCMQGFRFGRPSDTAEIAARLASPLAYRRFEGDTIEALAS